MILNCLKLRKKKKKVRWIKGTGNVTRILEYSAPSLLHNGCHSSVAPSDLGSYSFHWRLFDLRIILHEGFHELLLSVV